MIDSLPLFLPSPKDETLFAVACGLAAQLTKRTGREPLGVSVASTRSCNADRTRCCEHTALTHPHDAVVAGARQAAYEECMTNDALEKQTSAGGPKGPPKSRVKGSERRTLLLEAAAAIVVELGVSSVTMEEVAARNDVNKRLGYRYFANREALLKALFEQELQEATRRATAAITSVSGLRDVIAAYIKAWLELSEERGPLLSRLFSDQDVVPAVAREISDRAILSWSNTLRTPLGLSSARATTLAHMYLSALRGAVEALHTGVAPLAEVVEIYTTSTYAGAQAVAELPALR